MRHAIVILAHKNLSHVLRLVRYFEQDCNVLVHIDKKVKVDDDFLEELNSLPQVTFVSQQFDVNWGGSSILECELWLLRQALYKTDSEYFHIISGQDYPVRPIDFFLNFFDSNKGVNFMQFVHLPHKGWDNCTFRRFQYFYPYDYASDKVNPRRWVLEQVKKQQEKGQKRSIPDEFDHLYGGSQWISITRESVRVLLNYTDEKPSLYNRMWMTFAPEESYITTVLVNSIDKEKIKNSNHRYIRWKNENGNRPANLGVEHFFYLLESEYLFARKIEYPISEQLLDIIDEYLLRDRDVVHNQNGGWVYDGYLKYRFDAKFFSFVAQFYREVGVTKAIDMGCGSGYYVSRWRRLGLQFDGYDANPYTPSLSKRILHNDEEPCGIVDLTNELEGFGLWDLVVCKDVLQYIPEHKRGKAIFNLCNLSSHYIIFSYDIQVDMGTIYNPIDSNFLTEHMCNNGFEKDEYMTARMQVVSSDSNVCAIYRKSGKKIIVKS